MLRKIATLGILVSGGLCVVAIVNAQDPSTGGEERRSLFGQFNKFRENFTGSRPETSTPTERSDSGTPLREFGRGTRFINKPTPASNPTSDTASQSERSTAKPTTTSGRYFKRRDVGESQTPGRSVLTQERSSRNSRPAAASTKPIPQQSPGSFSANSSLSDRLRAVRSSATTPATSARRSYQQPTTDNPTTRVTSRPPVVKPAPRQTKPLDATLFTTKSPLIRVVTTGPRKIVIGKKAAYQINVTNSSDIAADEVVVSVKLPSWAEIANANPSTGSTHLPRSSEVADAFQWRISQLGANDREQLTLHLIPRKSRAFPLAVQWTFTPRASQTIVEVQEPRLQMAISGPDEVRYGATEQYRLTVSNPGTGDAENVVIRMSTSNSGNAPTARHVVGIIPAGASKVLKLKLTASQAGTLLVKAMAVGDGGLTDEVTEKVLVRRAGLQIQANGPGVRYAGTNAVFQVKVTNPGNDAAENVKIEAALPTGAKYIGSTDGLLSTGGNKVNWTIAHLQPGVERTFDVTCMLNTPGQNRLQVVASASHDLADTNTIATQVEALADLKLSVSDPQGPIPVGEEMEYVVRVRNRGSKQAEQIRMVVFFSSGVEAVKVTGGRHKIDVGQVTFDQINAIEANNELVFKIRARASKAGNHGFRVEVESVDPETRLVAEETTRFYGENTVRHQGIEGKQSNLGGEIRNVVPAHPNMTDRRSLPTQPRQVGDVRYE